MKKKDNRKVIFARVKPDLYRRLCRHVEKKQGKPGRNKKGTRTVAGVVEEALDDYLKKHQPWA